MNEHERIDHVLRIFRETYPDAAIALTYATPWELTVAVVLSAQCTDVMVNKVTDRLFKKYRNLEDYVRADPHEFEQDIKPTGFFRTKAKNILASAAIIQKTFQGQVPDTMEALLTLPGVARKTANIILGNVFGKVEGIAVDTHVGRISQRLRLVDIRSIGGKKHYPVETMADGTVTDFIKDADTTKIEQQLMALLPHDVWFPITYRIIDHGRAVCKAQHPLCGACPFARYCPVARQQ